MSQVDYLHFFNNVIWNLIQLIIMYLFICIVYVQSYYKIFRLRILNYKLISVFLKKEDYYVNKILSLFKEVYNFVIEAFKSYKLTDNYSINQKLIKCFYE